MAEEQEKKTLTKVGLESTNIRSINCPASQPRRRPYDQPFAAVLASASSTPAPQALAKL
jgi:hypothetical protein